MEIPFLMDSETVSIRVNVLSSEVLLAGRKIGDFSFGRIGDPVFMVNV